MASVSYVCAVADSTGNAPTVARLRFNFIRPDAEANPPFDEISRLFLGMRMQRQNLSPAQPEFGHQGLVPIHERLALDARQSRFVTVITPLLEHAS